MQLFIAEDYCLYIAQAIDCYEKGNVQEAIHGSIFKVINQIFNLFP